MTDDERALLLLLAERILELAHWRDNSDIVGLAVEVEHMTSKVCDKATDCSCVECVHMDAGVLPYPNPAPTSKELQSGR